MNNSSATLKSTAIQIKISIFILLMALASPTAFAGKPKNKIFTSDDAPIIRSVFIETPGNAVMSGYVGSKIILTGVNFKEVTAVTVNGIPIPVLEYNVSSEFTITFYAIATSGHIEVQTRYNGGALYGTPYTNLGYITVDSGSWNNDMIWLNKKTPPNLTDTAITIAHKVKAGSGILNVGRLAINKGGELTLSAVLNLFGSCINDGVLNNEGAFRMHEKSSFSGKSPAYTYPSVLEYVGYKGDIKDEWNGNGKIAGIGIPSTVLLNEGAALRKSNGIIALESGITIGNNCSFTLDSSDISLGGDWNKADSATFNPGSGNVTFKGSDKQKIVGTNTFSNVTINNSNGVIFLGATTISSTLNFVLGKATLENRDFIIQPNATIKGCNNRRYIVTTAKGKLFQEVLPSGTMYPIGNKSYNPVTFTAVSGHYGARVSDSIPSALNKDKMINRTWIVSGLSEKGNLTVLAQYNRGEPGKSFNATNPVLGFYGKEWNSKKAVLTEAGTTITAYSENLPIDAGEQYLILGNPEVVKTNIEPAVSLANETKTQTPTVIPFDVIIRPNPFVTYTKIIITSPDARVNVKISDATGKIMLDETREGSGTNTITAGADFPSGVYTVVIVTDSKTKSLRVVKR